MVGVSSQSESASIGYRQVAKVTMWVSSCMDSRQPILPRPGAYIEHSRLVSCYFAACPVAMHGVELTFLNTLVYPTGV